MLILQSLFSIGLVFTICLGVFEIENTQFFLNLITLLSVIVLFILEINTPSATMHNMKERRMRLSAINLVIPMMAIVPLLLLKIPLEITHLLILAIIFFMINSFYEKWQHHFFMALLLFFSVVTILIQLFFEGFQLKFPKNFIDLSLIIFPLGLYLLLQSQQFLWKLVILVLLAILVLPISNLSLAVFEIANLNWLFLSLLSIGVLLTIGLVFVLTLKVTKGEKKIFIFLGIAIIFSLVLLNALLFIITVALLLLAFKPLVRVTQQKISKIRVKLLLLISLGFLAFISFESYKNFQANIYYKKAKQQRTNQAIETLKQGLYYGNDSRYLEFLGDLYFKKGQLKSAENFYKQSLKISLKKETLLNKLAKIYRKQKQSKKLIQVLREKLEFKKTTKNFSELAKILRKYGFYHKALEVYQMAYEFDSNNADYCYNYGVMLATVEQYELATKVLLKGLAINNAKRFKIILKAIKQGKNITLE